MKLLSVKQARSIWLVNMADLNPRGRNFALSVVPAVINRYNFQVFPTKIEELDESKGVKFLAGTFTKDAQPGLTVDLTVYNDGLVVDTRSSTSDSDAFLEDLLRWVAQDFDVLPYHEALRTKIYLSELWVRSDKALNGLHPALSEFSKRLSSLTIGHRSPVAFEMSAISFHTDHSFIGAPGPFRFERADSTPFAENRYYSAAPLQTEIHLQMLNELEAILTTPN